MSDMIDIVQAVVNGLTTAAEADEFGASPPTIARAWDIDFDRKTLTGRQVKIAPIDESSERLDESSRQVDVFVVGTYAAKLTGSITDAAIDDHVARLALIRDWYWDNEVPGRDTWLSAVDDIVIPDRDSIRKESCVFAVWVWTFREIR